MLFSTTRAVLGSALLLSLSASATPTELSARETEEFKSIWFTMKFWALKDTSTVTSSHWHWSDKWLSKDKNQFLKKEGVPETRDFPDPVDGSPEQTQKYTIVGDMHFERVPPDNSWRDVYIVLDPGGPTQNNTKCSVRFDENPGVEIVDWYLETGILDQTGEQKPETGWEFACDAFEGYPPK